MRRSRLTTTLAAMATVVALSACGGEGGSTKDQAEAPITLDDLKPTPDDFFPGFATPDDLEVPEEYEDVASWVAGYVSQMLRISFEEPATYELTSDEDAVAAVASGFGSLEDADAANFAESWLTGAQEDAIDGERVATRFASTFAADTQPTDMFVYKLKWDASVDEASSTVTVTAVAWAGYEVDGHVLVAARQLAMTGVDDEGPNVSYSTKQPVSGGIYDLCASVVDGVLAPDPDGITQAQASALRKEFADTKFRPLGETLLVEGDGADAGSDRKDRVKSCLAEG